MYLNKDHYYNYCCKTTAKHNAKSVFGFLPFLVFLLKVIKQCSQCQQMQIFDYDTISKCEYDFRACWCEHSLAPTGKRQSYMRYDVLFPSGLKTHRSADCHHWLSFSLFLLFYASLFCLAMRVSDLLQGGARSLKTLSRRSIYRCAIPLINIYRCALNIPR